MERAKFKYYDRPKFPVERLPDTPPDWRVLAAQVTGYQPANLLMNEAERVAVDLHWGVLELAFQMAIAKKWIAGYKPPVPRKIIEAAKPLADWLLSILELCVQLHALGMRESRSYANAIEWFGQIFMEMHRNGLTQVSSPGSKRMERDRMWAEIADLCHPEGFRNPYKESEQPHLWRLIECGCKVANTHYGNRKKNPNFAELYWLGNERKPHPIPGMIPFIPAYRRWAKAFEEGDQWTVRWQEDGKILGFAPGKGQGPQKQFIELPGQKMP